ncbi:MAG: BrxA/BrxB family bacilliredoxin [Gemmatimonadales bacterium]
MSYPEMMIKPMREDVTRLGVTELRTVEDVDQALGSMQGTAMVFVNSVCGCAAGGARPALMMALAGEGKSLDHLYTVFAGQDLDATARARSYFGEYQPSSPSFAFLKDGEVVGFIHRHQIEGRHPEDLSKVIRDQIEAVS